MDPELQRLLLGMKTDGPPPFDVSKLSLAPPGDPNIPGFGPMPDAPPVPGADTVEGGYIPPEHMPAQLDVPDMPAQKPGFFERLLHVPSAVEGQFTPEDLRAMRARALINAGAAMATGTDNLIPALTKGLAVMQNSFGSDIDAGLKTTAMSNEVGNTTAMRKADAQIAAKYPPVAGESPAEKLLRISNMAADYGAMGQPDRAKALAEVAKNLKASLMKGGDKGFQKVHDTAGNYGIFDPSTGQFKFNEQEGWVDNHLDPGVAVQNAFRIRRMNQADQNRYMQMNHFERQQYDEALKGFYNDPQVKPVMTAHNGFLTLQKTLEDAVNNPAATSVVTGQLANFADPRARLQMQMMLYLENINPSLAGKLKRYASEAFTGTLPASQIKDVKSLVDDIEQASEGGVRAARERYIKSLAPALDVNLMRRNFPTVEDMFSKPDASGGMQMVDPDEDQEK